MIRSERKFEIGRRRQLRAVMAAEVAECGLACLVTIGRYYGQDIDLNGVRQQFPISLSGASLRNLMQLSDQLGFSARALRVELNALRSIRLPAVIHWDLDHFVVLGAIDSKTAVIYDPARGKRQIALDDLSKHYTGVALELEPTASFKNVRAEAPIRLTSLWTRIEGFWSNAIQLFLLSAALLLAGLLAPFQMQLVVDQAIAGGDADILAVVAIGFAVLLVLQAALEAIRSLVLQLVSFLLSYQVKGNLVHHLLRLPADYFERRHVGDILSRMGSAGAIQSFFTQGVIAAVLDGVMALVAIVILLIYSQTLTGIVVVGAILMTVASIGFYPAMRARLEENLVSSAKESSHMIESVRAATTIKLLGGETEREGNWRNLYGDVVNASLASGKLAILSGFTQTMIGGLQSILVVYVGALAILRGDGFSVGMLIAFLSYRQMFTSRVGALVSQFIQFRLLRLHLERLSDIVATEADPTSALTSNEPINGVVSVRNVSYRYGASDPFVFENISLEIAQGDFIAIAGPSGGGKTTLLKLLLGLHAPSAGEILIDGSPATPERWRNWRRYVGVVAQDDRLLSGSIADNICFFDPDMNMEAIKRAAQAAHVHEDIIRKPMHYRTLVGDMGSALSGGQRQRILLARALYRNPSVLILDEGTANLDEQTEERLADLVAELGMTRIVVAHRPALVRRAHRVCYLDENGLTFRRGAATQVTGVV